MSQENVERFRRNVEAFNRRDFAALADYSHEEIEFVSVLAAVDAQAAEFRGRETWVNYFASWTRRGTGGRSQISKYGTRVTIWLLRSCTCVARASKAVRLSTRRSGSRTGSGQGSYGGCVPTPIHPRPSKPWGCGSRPCALHV